MDRPRIEQVIAWKRDEAVFDDVSLAEAVAE
jgi:transmembrane sensor